MLEDINDYEGSKVVEKLIKRSIIIVSVMILLLLLVIYVNVKKEEVKQEEEEIQEIEEIKILNLESEEYIYTYMISNDVMNNFFNYISEKEVSIDNKKALFNVLDEKYKMEKEITEDNVINILSIYKNVNSFFSKEIYRQEIAHRQNINGQYIYIKGIVRIDGKEEYIYILMKQDYMNSTYSVRILSEDEFYSAGENATTDIEIKENDYNKITGAKVTDYSSCLEFFNDYFNTIKNNPEKGYELLKSEYREARFNNSMDEYVEYVNSTKDRISNAVLKSCSIKEIDGKKIYICLDQNGNYYIFEKENMMNYNVMLDKYTIPLQQFIDKYNASNTIERVGINITTVIEAINNKDYSYIYDRLDETFKENNYQTEEKFVETIKNNLFENNIVGKVSSSNEGDIYIYKVSISSIDDISNQKNMTVIMQLKEEMDFVMSYSFN